MPIVIKQANPAMLEDYCKIEAASGIGISYLKDVFPYYQGFTVGDLSCAYLDGTPAGIGKLTRLYDGSAWLETLRVAQKYQGLGVGKALYRHFRQEAAALGCKTMRMYTGLSNAASEGLAAFNGFVKVATHQGMYLELAGSTAVDPVEGFQMAVPMEAAGRYRDIHDKFFCMNRTFYSNNQDTLAGFAAEGKVFLHGPSGSSLLLGARFQQEKGLHLAAPTGDLGLCVQFAITHAAAMGLPRLTCTFAADQTALRDLLAGYGFVAEPSPTIVMEGTV